jgi:hypothetical protein
VYSLGLVHDRLGIKRFLDAAERVASAARHPHLLRVEAYALADHLGACIVCPYPGHHAGVITLDMLLKHKSGTMPPGEVQRATTHLLEGAACMHEAGITDSALDLDRVHVDPRGSLRIELPGLWRMMWRQRAQPDPREDVRACVGMAFKMMTGADVAANASHSLPALDGMDRGWKAWFAQGLDPSEGFATAADALSHLPAGAAISVEPKSQGLVRSLLNRIRAAKGS